MRNINRLKQEFDTACAEKYGRFKGEIDLNAAIYAPHDDHTIAARARDTSNAVAIALRGQNYALSDNQEDTLYALKETLKQIVRHNNTLENNPLVPGVYNQQKLDDATTDLKDALRHVEDLLLTYEHDDDHAPSDTASGTFSLPTSTYE